MKWLIIFLWLILGVFYYTVKTNHQQDCCTNAVIKEQPATPAKGVERDPLLFEYNNNKAFTTDKFPDYKRRILAGLKDGQNLIVTGYYGADEVNNTQYDNLGLARAEAIKTLLIQSPGIDKDRIITRGALNNASIRKDELFKSYAFSVENKQPPKKVIQLKDRTLIYFEYGTDRPIEDQEVLTYLNQVAATVKSSGQKVYLTGHTDSHSSKAYNYRLGLKRANKIADYLKKHGVPSNQMVVRSKGETAPIAPNTTDSGRQKNRRVALEIK